MARKTRQGPQLKTLRARTPAQVALARYLEEIKKALGQSDPGRNYRAFSKNSLVHSFGESGAALVKEFEKAQQAKRLAASRPTKRGTQGPRLTKTTTPTTSQKSDRTLRARTGRRKEYGKAVGRTPAQVATSGVKKSRNRRR